MTQANAQILLINQIFNQEYPEGLKYKYGRFLFFNSGVSFFNVDIELLPLSRSSLKKKV